MPHCRFIRRSRTEKPARKQEARRERLAKEDGETGARARRSGFKASSVLRACALALALLASAHATASVAPAQRRQRPPAVGRISIVVDERLAALRDAPEPSARLVRRLGRGRMVAVSATRRVGGLTFHRVAVTRRTSGWVQAEALVSPSVAGDDARLLRLVQGSADFDRIARARIFLEAFPRSKLRPAALLIFGDEAALAADKLSREAVRRLDAREMEAGGAPVESYFLNYNGLDRYRRQGIVFRFDAERRLYAYDGAAWREILRRHPESAEAQEARRRLEATRAGVGNR